MLFQSQFYILVFLPVSLSIYYACAGSERLRHAVLVASSLFFYGWWDARFIPLLLGQIGATWLLTRLHAQFGVRWPLVVGVVINLSSLVTFKYLDFLLTSVESLTATPLPRAGIVLPIGISFFSFQLISYLVDRMRGQAPLYPLRPFALVVLVFPHLIAGPIVRHNELVPQFALDPRRQGRERRFGVAAIIFTMGLAKKVLISDRLATIADPLFDTATRATLSFGDAWTAALAFSFQLLLDFSAYTEMAIGSALMFGLVLPENFRRPYSACDLRDFWRRWHISLSNFIRDYLYIPLGGSRQGAARYVFATLGSMALCGLWHGAGWTYVAWGVWHGVGLVTCRAWQQVGRPMPAAVGWLATMVFVLAGWVVFRAADFPTAHSILLSLTGLNGFGGRLGDPTMLVIAALASALLPSAHEIKDACPVPRLALATFAGLLAAYCVLDVGGGVPVNFIYFQF